MYFALMVEQLQHSIYSTTQRLHLVADILGQCALCTINQAVCETQIAFCVPVIFFKHRKSMPICSSTGHVFKIPFRFKLTHTINVTVRSLNLPSM